MLSVVSENGYLGAEEWQGFLRDAVGDLLPQGQRCLCIIPDATRSMPLDSVFPLVCRTAKTRGATVDFLIALGTHPPMSDSEIYRMLGITSEIHQEQYARVNIFNHCWQDDSALVAVGELTEQESERLTDGFLKERVAVRINRKVLEYDRVFIFGPVFPHEVVGFSGGAKYLFPGVSGPEILHFFHWLGALITNLKINGVKDTPVRRVIHHAARMVPTPIRAFCFVVQGKNVKGIFVGDLEEAWSAAVDVSARTHIIYMPRAYTTVLALAPEMYDELWVAGKCMYKLEPIVADGGELIIYGPHIRRISVTHGAYIRRIGYHVRDYFVKQMERFQDIPRGVLAHSTHVRGSGTYENGVERPRIQVTLATEIPQEECEAVNLGYRDWRSLCVEDFQSREEEGILVVPKAGEVLYRLQEQIS